MGWTAIIAGVIQTILLGLKIYYERDQERRKKVHELREEFKVAIKGRDYAHLSLLFDRAKRLR